MIMRVTSHQIVSDLAVTIKKSDKLTQRLNFYLALLGEDEVARGIISRHQKEEKNEVKRIRKAI